MRFVLFSVQGAPARLGVFLCGGLIDASPVVSSPIGPQAAMVQLIDRYKDIKERLAALAGPIVPRGQVEVLPLLPRPGKVVNCIGNYWEDAQRDPRPLNMFLKYPDAVIGPGDSIRPPEYIDPCAFMYEAELALVFKGPVKAVPKGRWSEAIFGYTCLIDVTNREVGRWTWRRGNWMVKSFGTFAPIGPCIVTADEIEDSNDLWVRI